MKPSVGDGNLGANIREAMEVVDELDISNLAMTGKMLRSKSLRGGTKKGMKVTSSKDVRVRAQQLNTNNFPQSDVRSRAMELIRYGISRVPFRAICTTVCVWYI
jgi:hypothetical protein